MALTGSYPSKSATALYRTLNDFQGHQASYLGLHYLISTNSHPIYGVEQLSLTGFQNRPFKWGHFIFIPSRNWMPTNKGNKSVYCWGGFMVGGGVMATPQWSPKALTHLSKPGQWLDGMRVGFRQNQNWFQNGEEAFHIKRGWTGATWATDTLMRHTKLKNKNKKTVIPS